MTYLLFAFLFFGPRVGFFDTSLLVALLTAAYFTVTKPVIVDEALFSPLIGSFTFILLYSLGMAGLYWLGIGGQLADRFYYSARLFRVIAIAVLLWVFASERELEDAETQVMRAIIVVGLLHVVAVIVSVFNLFGLRDVVLMLNTYNVADDESWRELLEGVRSKGLMTGYDVSGLFSATWMLVVAFYVRGKFAKTILLSLGTAAVILGSRTGLVALAMAYLVALCYWIGTQRRRFAIHITAISVATLAVVAFADRIVGWIGDEKSLKKAFEMFFNFYSTGSLVTASSSDTLSNHYLWQGPWWVFFISEPIRSNAFGNLGLDTDVGYMQIIHNFGIFAGIVIVLLHLSMLAAGRRVPPRIFRLHVCMTVVILVTCLKGPYFFARGPYDIWVVSFVLCSLYKKRHGIDPCVKPIRRREGLELTT